MKLFVKQLINPKANRSTNCIQNHIINIKNTQSCEILKTFYQNNYEKKIQNQKPKIIEFRKDNS